jgi:hypothetical protein
MCEGLFFKRHFSLIFGIYTNDEIEAGSSAFLGDVTPGVFWLFFYIVLQLP